MNRRRVAVRVILAVAVCVLTLASAPERASALEWKWTLVGSEPIRVWKNAQPSQSSCLWGMTAGWISC